jgi:hypothetical protein
MAAKERPRLYVSEWDATISIASKGKKKKKGEAALFARFAASCISRGFIIITPFVSSPVLHLSDLTPLSS